MAQYAAQSALGIPDHATPAPAASRTFSQPPPTLPSIVQSEPEAESSSSVQPVADNAHSFAMPPPRLSRAFTMPLPSQLGHLQRPQLQSSSLRGSTLSTTSASSNSSDELATELADSVQMVIQTLLQISPPQLLDPAKEQLSGCALQVPTPSISALFTSMKMLNYMSKHMTVFSPSSSDADSTLPLVEDEFDVGELLQSVGDALSGVAAEAGVDLVIFHADSSLKDLRIRTDECCLIYILSYIARQILNTATRGDVLEIGLRLTPEAGTSSIQLPATLEPNQSLFCTFEFKHKSSRQPSTTGETTLKITPKSHPNLNTPTMATLLRKLKAEIVTTPSLQSASLQTKYDLLARVRRGEGEVSNQIISSEDEAVRQPFPDLRLAREPTITELVDFARTLKGRKATFHASTRSSFAHYLTIYLTGWGMDVTHVPTDTGLSTPPSSEDPVSDPLGDDPAAVNSEIPQTVSEPEKLLVPTIEVPIGPVFTIIDDDIGVLKVKLSELDHPLHIPSDIRPKRPSLADHHRPNSFLARRAIGVSNTTSLPHSTTSVVVYFTSLSNYREVRDVVQAITAPKKDRRPEIIVIPKPAGVRRFLTALYTATTKPLVDPVFFSPIATSPMSPARHSTPFFSQPSQSPGANEASPAPSGASVSDTVTTAFSSGEHTPIQSLATSPLSTGGYFEREGNKIAGSASSGLFVKSPDGRTGIFFQPFATFEEHGLATQSDRPGPSIASSVAETAASQARALIGDASLNALEMPANGRGQPSERAIIDQNRLIFPVHHSPPILSNPLGAPGDPVFERGSVTVKPAKPTKASIVGMKAKKQSDLVVPPISVLIVEDNAIQRTILSTFMKNKHISYGMAENGEEAVKEWEKGNYHLVLMDIQMPVMDGIEATKKIREIELARHRALGSFTPQSEGPPTPTSATSGDSRQPSTPFHSSVIIVALTAQSSTQDRVAALSAGCNDFLSKPVKLQWLERKIIEWGSIKALQMWADPEVEPLLHKRQQASAQIVADNLHIGRLAKGSSQL